MDSVVRKMLEKIGKEDPFAFKCAWIHHTGKEPSEEDDPKEHVFSCVWCQEWLKENEDIKGRSINKHGWWDGHPD